VSDTFHGPFHVACSGERRRFPHLAQFGSISTLGMLAPKEKEKKKNKKKKTHTKEQKKKKKKKKKNKKGGGDSFGRIKHGGKRKTNLNVAHRGPILRKRSWGSHDQTEEETRLAVADSGEGRLKQLGSSPSSKNKGKG